MASSLADIVLSIAHTRAAVASLTSAAVLKDAALVEVKKQVEKLQLELEHLRQGQTSISPALLVLQPRRRIPSRSPPPSAKAQRNQ